MFYQIFLRLDTFKLICIFLIGDLELEQTGCITFLHLNVRFLQFATEAVWKTWHLIFFSFEKKERLGETVDFD